MANCFGCLNRPSFFLQAAAADAAAAAALVAVAAGAPLSRKPPAVVRVFRLAEQRRAERGAEGPRIAISCCRGVVGRLCYLVCAL